jgi:hypothetical protein
MPIVESTAKRLVLKSGSTTLSLDKDTGKMTLQQKILFWKPKPAEAALSDVTEIKIEKVVDRASGAEIYHSTLVTKGGAGWFFPANDQKDAEANAAKLRDFIGLKK